MRTIALLTAAASLALSSQFAMAQAPDDPAEQESPNLMETDDDESPTLQDQLQENLGIGNPADQTDVDLAISSIQAAPDFATLGDDFTLEVVQIRPAADCDPAMVQDSPPDGTWRAGILCTDDTSLITAMGTPNASLQSAIDADAELRARLEAAGVDTGAIVGANVEGDVVRVYTQAN